MKYIFGVILYIFSLQILNSQVKEKPILKPYKIGFLYNYGNEENFIFNDPDYSYKTNTIKFQGFYKLKKWNTFSLDLIVQPQIQFLKHQLINEQFVTPDQENYLEKREEFTTLKDMNLYGLEFTFMFSKILSKSLSLQTGISLGFSYIDTRTERLAKGFTFVENFSIGFSKKIFKHSYLYLGSNFGHVSNLNFQKPNDGYNILGVELGYSIQL